MRIGSAGWLGAAIAGAALAAGCGSGAGTGSATEPAPAGATAAATQSTAATGSPDAAAGARPAAATPPAQGSAAAGARIEGRWTRGDTDSRYVAHFEGGTLRYLEEDMSLGDHGRRSQRYWYEDGALVRYEGEKPSDLPVAPGALPPNVPVIAEFRGPDVLRAVAREHSGEKKLDETTLDGIRRHAAALAGAATDEWSARAR